MLPPLLPPVASHGKQFSVLGRPKVWLLNISDDSELTSCILMSPTRDFTSTPLPPSSLFPHLTAPQPFATWITLHSIHSLLDPCSQISQSPNFPLLCLFIFFRQLEFSYLCVHAVKSLPISLGRIRARHARSSSVSLIKAGETSLTTQIFPDTRFSSSPNATSRPSNDASAIFTHFPQNSPIHVP